MSLDLTNLEVINARERYGSIGEKLTPKVDEVVSKIVGKKIFVQDPRLMKLIVKWKQNKPVDSMQPDNFFADPTKVKELIQTLNGNL